MSVHRRHFDAGALVGRLVGAKQIAPDDARLSPLRTELRNALVELEVIHRGEPLPSEDEISHLIQDHSGELDSACFEVGADLLLLQTHLKIASLARGQPGIPATLLRATIDSLKPLVNRLRLRFAQIGAPETIDAFIQRVSNALTDVKKWLKASGDLFEESEVVVVRVRLILESPQVQPIRRTNWQKTAAFALGGIFVIVLLLVALVVPNPTEFQLFVFRVILALAAAGVAALIPGFFHIESKTALYAVRAGGALGVFLLVYLVNPPALLHTEHHPPESQRRVDDLNARLEATLLSRIGGFQVHVMNNSLTAAKQVTVSLKTWQIGAPGPDVVAEFPIRDLAPSDDFTLNIEPFRSTNNKDYDRRRASQPTCGQIVVRSINSSKPRGWAFFIPGQDQQIESFFYKLFYNHDPWPIIEFDYPRSAPQGFECVDYPVGICKAVGKTIWIWTP